MEFTPLTFPYSPFSVLPLFHLILLILIILQLHLPPPLTWVRSPLKLSVT